MSQPLIQPSELVVSSQNVEVVIAAGATATLTIPAYITDLLNAVVFVKVTDGTKWYDGVGVSTLAYTASAITLTNNDSVSRAFRYKIIR